MAAGSMLLLMYGVFRKTSSTAEVSWGAVLLFIITAVVIVEQGDMRAVTFGGMFVVDPFTHFVKLLILLAAAASVIMSVTFIRREGMDRFEFPVLISLAALGMLMMVSANSLIALYLGIELQSLSIYVIAAFNRDSAKSSATVASGPITRSTELCEMSRSCQSATFSSAGVTMPRISRAMPVTFSVSTGLRLCGIADEPFWPGAKYSSASATSLRCRCRISVARFSIEPATTVSTMITICSTKICVESRWRSPMSAIHKW